MTLGLSHFAAVYCMCVGVIGWWWN